MTIRGFFLLFICSCAGLVADALPIEPTIRMGEFPNGVRYYIRREEHIEPGRASVRLVVPVGSVLEEEGELGAAHFVEHLVFRGTDFFSDEGIRGFLKGIGASMGADVNAYTSFDETVYRLEVPPGDGEQLSSAMQLLSQWCSAATLADRDVEQERGVILDEWRRGLGVNLRVMESAFEALTRGCRYGERLPIGTEASIREMSAMALQEFYDHWYRGAPLAVVVVGNVDEDRVEREIAQQFEPLERASVQLPDYEFVEGAEPAFALTRDPELSGASVQLMFKKGAEPVLSVDDLRRSLVMELFREMMGARLRELAEHPESSLGQAGIFSVRVIRPMEAHILEGRCIADRVAVALLELALELKRVQSDGFTTTEFQRAVAEQRKALKLYRSSQEGRSTRKGADDCVSHFLNETPLCGPDFVVQVWEELLAELQVSDVSQMASGWSVQRDCVIHVSVPDTPDVPHVDADLMRRIVEWVDQSELPAYVDRFAGEELMPVLPAPGEVISIERHYHPDMVELELENGMRIWLLRTPSADDSIILTGLAPGGLCDAWNNRAAADLLNESGIGGHSPAQLRKLLGGQKADLTRLIRPYSRDLVGRCLSEDLEALLQLVHLAFTDQQNDPQAFEAIRATLQEQLYADERSPQDALARRVQQINWSRHPFFDFPTQEEIDALDFDEADQQGRDAFSNPADFQLVLVGDFDWNQAHALVNRYLASIPKRGEARTSWNPLDARFRENVRHESMELGGGPQSMVQLTFPLELQEVTPEQFEVVAIAERLISGEVSDILRDRLGGTYHVDSWVEWMHPDPRLGVFSLQFSCDPQDAELLAQVALRELRLLRTRGPLQENVDDLIQERWRRLTRELKQKEFWAGEAQLALLYGWGHEALHDVRERLEGLNDTMVYAQVEQMLPLDRHTLVIVSPEDVDIIATGTDH
jgi:zinc protease